MGCELYVGQSALQAGPSPRGRKDRRYLADPGRRSEARGRPYLERKVYRRETATPEIPEKMRSPLLHSASLCTPAASRSGRWLCDRDEALRCYIRRRAGCLCDPELRSAALSCLWGYHVRRHAIDSAGVSHWYLLRRWRCPACQSFHLELPDFMAPRRHYEAETIRDVQIGDGESCPADDSTIRRWKKAEALPALPVTEDTTGVK